LAGRRGAPQQRETLEWVEPFDGEIILMSLVAKRFLRVVSTDEEPPCRAGGWTVK